MHNRFVYPGCALLLGAALSASANQALNPNFIGPINTDYTVVTTPHQWGPGASWTEGTVAVNTNPNNSHGLWNRFGTPTGAPMLLVNASATPGARVWYETLQAGDYDFSALVANIYPASPAELTLELDGNAIGSVFAAPNPPGTWTEWNETVHVTGTEVLSIVDLNTERSGNDFALANVPDAASTSAMLGAAASALAFARRRLRQ